MNLSVRGTVDRGDEKLGPARIVATRKRGEEASRLRVVAPAGPILLDEEVASIEKDPMRKGMWIATLASGEQLVIQQARKCNCGG